jgi:tetratricopeptide (TPR) repeat protein
MIDNALKALDHALLLGPDGLARFDAVTLNISGDNLYQKGDMDGAVEEFEKALLIDPENVNVINSLGVCHGVKGEHGKAIEAFAKAMSLDAGDVMAPYNLGLSYVMTGDRDKALEFLLKAFALDENQFEVALQLGRLYLDKEKPETALEYLEKAVKMDKESAPAHRFLGECHNELKKAPEAIRSYSEAVKLNGNDAYSLSALGVLYAEEGKNLDIALVFCEQSVELAPETALFHHRLAQVYLKLERFQDALEAFERAEQLGHDCESQIRMTRERLREIALDRETRQ